VNTQRTNYNYFREGKKSPLDAKKVALRIDAGFVFSALHRRGCKLGDDMREMEQQSSALAGGNVNNGSTCPHRQTDAKDVAEDDGNKSDQYEFSS